MSKAKKEYKRITVKSLLDMKIEGEKISMLTAYDFTTAAIVDGSGIDIILGPERESILADVFESLCGYIYLFMGFDDVKKFIINSLRNEIEHLENLKDIKDSKSILQEILQKKGIDVPIYKIKSISNNDNEISFEAKVYSNDKLLAKADGKRKSIAEQKAAEKAILNLKKLL